MFFNFSLFFIILLLNKVFICGQPITAEEEEDHLNVRLAHYLKRLELLIAQNPNTKFLTELQNLRDKVKHSLAKESFKEKFELLEQQIKLPEFADYLATEFDKQFINEDILMEIWYLNEILSQLPKDLYEEANNVISNLKEAYRAKDFDKKINLFSDVGENFSEKLLDYFYGEDKPVPMLNAQLKYYYEYLIYLLKEYQAVGGEFEKPLEELKVKVTEAMASAEKTVKENVVNLFDDLSTKFGRYLDEHLFDFNMFKFGE